MTSHNFRTFAVILAAGALAAACSDEPTQLRPQQPIPKPAFSVDLTNAGGPTTINNALWWSVYVFPSGSVGTGNLKPFMRIQDSPNESGFNNDNNPAGEDADHSWTNRSR